MLSPPDFEVPHGNVIDVKLIDATKFGPAQIHRFMCPPVPGLQTFRSSPSLSFLLEHRSGRRLVFDLGIRKDFTNYSSKVANYIPTTGYEIEVKNNVSEILHHAGIDLATIEAVIWSHWHWDHIGDPSTFPATTSLIVGPGFKSAMLPGYPANPDSPIRESDYEGRELREISFQQSGALKLGQFPAFDYFGDGSFYLLDSPGHAIGHLCGLARTTSNPDTFVLLGGDVCHYAGIFRPSEYIPIPDTISPSPFQGMMEFCPGHAFEELQASRGRKSTDTIYDMCFGHDIPLATETMRKLQHADCKDNILVIIAHDTFAREHVPHFPKSLNDWHARNLGKRLRWAFLRDLDQWWKSKGLLEGA